MTLGAAAYHGPLARAAEMWAPYIEPDPGPMLASLLTLAGNAVGFGPYLPVRLGSRHSTVLQVVIVAPTSLGRKTSTIGESRGLVQDAADTEWRRRVRENFSSGEAIAQQVADPVTDSTSRTQVGSTDKRLMIVIDEFTKMLKAAARPSSTIVETVCQAYDGRPIGAGSIHSPLFTESHHISLLAATTPRNLVKHLTPETAETGFANRFLFVGCERRNSIAIPSDYPRELEERSASFVQSAIHAAKGRRRIQWGTDARAAHEQWYADWSVPERLHSFLAREDAHVQRLAMCYAAFDGCDEIGMDHLLAAREWVAESRRVVIDLWGSASEDSDAGRLLGRLRMASSKGLTRSDIHDWSGWLAGQTDAASKALVEMGLAHLHTVQGRLGRPSLTAFDALACPICANGHRPTAAEALREAVQR